MFRRLLSKLGFNKPKETILPQSILVPEPAALVPPPPRVFTPVEEIAGIRRLATAPAYKAACAQSVEYYEKKYGVKLNKADCMAICSSVWFALDLWKQLAFVRCAVDINDVRAEMVFQLAIPNDRIQDFLSTLDVLLRKNSATFRADIATVGTRSYALIHIWRV